MITLQEATEYFINERLFSDKWLGAPLQVQIQSLKMAENQINRLKFSNYNDDLKETKIKKAMFEQALYLFETSNTQRSRLIEQGVTSFSVEGLSESYSSNSSAKNKICSEAREYLKPYLLGCASIC